MLPFLIMRIDSIDDLDKEKLYKAIKPISPMYITYFRQFEQVIDGKWPELEAHQCKCGNMVILPSEEVKEKLKKSNASELSCHICGGYEDEMRDTVLDENFLKLMWLLRKYESSPNSLKKELFEKIQNLAKQFFSFNDINEINYGCYNLMRILYPKNRETNRYYKPLNNLILKAKSNNKKEFNKLLNNLKDKTSVTDSLFDFTMAAICFDFFKYLRLFCGIEVSDIDKYHSNRDYKLIQELIMYAHSTESDWDYDVIFNLSRIANGHKFTKDTFRGLSNKGKVTKQIHPTGKIKELKKQKGIKKLSADISSLVDPKLRNAIYHSQYRIFDKYIKITTYNTNLGKMVDNKMSISRFRSLAKRYDEFHSTLSNLLSDYYAEMISEKIKDMGITNMRFSLITDNENKKQFMKFEFFQYWDSFLLNTKDKSFSFGFKLSINKENKELNLRSNRVNFKGKVDQSVIDYINSNEKFEYQIFIHIIAPRLRFFNQHKIGFIKFDDNTTPNVIGSLDLSNKESLKEEIERLKTILKDVFA